MNAIVLCLLLAQESRPPVRLVPREGPPPPVRLAPKPDPSKELSVDLASTPTGAAFPASAPSASFNVRLRNAAPSSTYRVVIDVGGPQSSVRSRDVGMPTQSMLTVMPTPNATCAQLQRQEHDLLRTTDEAAVPAKVAALEKALADGVCPSRAMLTGLAIERTRPSVQWVTLAAPDTPVNITVERVSTGEATAPKRWQVTTGLKSEPLRAGPASEEEWLVAAVSDRIAKLLSSSLPAGAVTVSRATTASMVPTYTVTVRPGVSQAITFGDHIWSPRAYAPLATALIAGAKGVPSGARPEASALSALLDLRASTIQKENQRVSAWLGRERLNPAAHEQAALVVGALALREAAGDFWDAGPLLNRMAAHVAVAEALRRGSAPSLDGQIAMAVLASVTGREKEALERLALIKPASASAPEAAWVRALGLRNTRDWRSLPEPTKATLLERLEYFRAAENAGGLARAMAFLDARPPEPLADWAYVALEKQTKIEEGHRFAPSALDLQVAEIKDIYRSFQGRELTDTALPQALNERHPGPEVLDWATWAGFFERHVEHLVNSINEFYDELASPHDAEQFQKQATASFGALHLHPFNQLRWAVDAFSRGSDPAAAAIDSQCRRIAPLLRESPERVSSGNWAVVSERCRNDAAAAASVPAYDRWFQSVTPFGTVLDPERRLMVPPAAHRVDLRLAESLLALAPREYHVVEYHINRSLGAKASDEQLAAAYADLAGYDVRAVRRWAGRVKDRPETYQRVAGRMCDLDADLCLDLADYLADREMDDSAIVAFEKALQRGHDKVAASQMAERFMHYYFDRQQLDKAGRIAEEAGATNSDGGLVTMGRFLERQGKYPEAESYYRRVAERYDNDQEVDQFYIRRDVRAKDGRYHGLAAEAMKRVFPEGMQRVAIGDFTTAPRGDVDSAVVTADELTEKFRRYGVRLLDRIVALDGYRVHDWAQYLAVRSFTDDPQMSTIVWRDGRCVEIKGTFHRRRFGP